MFQSLMTMTKTLHFWSEELLSGKILRKFLTLVLLVWYGRQTVDSLVCLSALGLPGESQLGEDDHWTKPAEARKPSMKF